MAAPVAVVAKWAAKKGLRETQKRFPGGILGLIGALLAGLLFLVMGLVSAVLGLFGGAAASLAQAAASQCNNGWSEVSPLATADISVTALDAYKNAGRATGIDWAYIAALGKIETQHGTYQGSKVHTDGSVRPQIIGIALDGTNNTRAIKDTDNGALDRDRVWDRAVGPMQFIPTTWAAEKRDGNHDGKFDPHNIYDAALATAFNLKRNGAPGNMRAAFYAYNNSDAYVDMVMEQAGKYRKTGGDQDGDGLSDPFDLNSETAYMAPVSKKTGPDAAGLGGWVQPMAAGTYTLTNRWGIAREYYASGHHTGLDYDGVTGDPVFAVGPGTVTVRTDQGWAGPHFVTIDHGKVDGKQVETWYAHMSAASVTSGQQVAAGDQIGLLGNEGKSFGDHLHLEVRVNGVDVDPEIFLATAGAPSADGLGGCGPTDYTGMTTGSGAWGGHQNGKIPADALAVVSFQSSCLLREDAAKALEALNVAYKARFGANIGPLDCFRSYEDQVALYAQKPDLAAQPGTSNHGWAMAVDTSINDFGSAQFRWMTANAVEYGWVHPEWARQGGGREEPWHWEFGVIS